MDATLITALGGLLTVINGIFIGIMTARSNAQKAEMESLRSTIEILQDENTRLSKRRQFLEEDKRKASDEVLALKIQNAGKDRQIRDQEGIIEKLSKQIVGLGSKPTTGPLKMK